MRIANATHFFAGVSQAGGLFLLRIRKKTVRTHKEPPCAASREYHGGMDEDPTYGAREACGKRNVENAQPDVPDREGAVPPPRKGASKKTRVLVLGIMMAGTTAACISQSMMITALPTIMVQYGVDATLGQLLTTAYIFTLGLISATTAFLIDRIPAKRLFIAAMLLFVAGCVAALAAPSYPLLLAARLVQAGGAGICLPLIQVVALSLYPPSEYGKAMGISGLVIGFAPAIGPTIAGVLIDVWGWHSIFVVLGSVALVVAVVAAALLGEIGHAGGQAGRFDVVSTLQYVTGLVACMAGVTVAESGESGAVLAIGLFAAGAAMLVVFVRRQLRVEHPLLDLRCFRNRTFAVATVLVLVTQVAFMAGSIMVPLYVQDIQGRSATISGFTILPGALLLGILNPVTGRYLDRHGALPLIVFGGAVTIAGTLAFCVLDPAVPEWAVTVLYGVRIVGISCLMMPMQAYGTAALPVEELSQATAILTSFRQIFGSIMSSVLISFMAALSSNASGVDAFGFGASFALQAAIVLVGIVAGAAYVLRTRRKRS